MEAFLGSCAHKAFEELYNALMHGRIMSLEETIGFFEKQWDDQWSQAVIIRDKKFTPENWRNIGCDCVRLYYEQHEPFAADKTVEVEKRVGFPLDVAGEEYRIEGFIDRLSLGPDGVFEIHDYKTSRSLPSQEKLDQDWQLAIYDLAVRHSWPDAQEVRLVWHYVRHGKSLVSRRTLKELEVLKKEIASLIETIKHDHEFLPRKSALCDWCEYRDLCPLWSHAEKVERMSLEELKKDDGVRLVDELGVIDAKKHELRNQLKSLEQGQRVLEEALLRFAESLGLMAVSGLGSEVVITEKEEYKFPTKTHDPEALEALETELKKSPFWDDVSHLDPHRLLEGSKKRLWPEPFLGIVEGLINRFVKISREKTLRYRKKKEVEED